MKLTTRLHSVRPISSLASLRERPSTSTRCTLPTRDSLMRRALSSMTACKCCRRASFTACGVSSCSAAAGVPGRGLKTKLKLPSKPTSAISFIVFAKSSSVSPGKPTMKSLDRLMPVRTARSLRTVLLYSIAV